MSTSRATSPSIVYLLNCDRDGCVAVSEAWVRIREWLYGGSSKRWQITLNASRVSGNHSFDISFDYECGVNIPNATDSTCSTWKNDGADRGYVNDPAWDGYQANQTFGSTANATKFPMVRFYLEWDTGTQMIGPDGERGIKFRGWDTCVKARATKLCTSTGTGA